MGGVGREIGRALACGQAAGLVCAALAGPAAVSGSLLLQQLGPAAFWALVFGLVASSFEAPLGTEGRVFLGVAVGAVAAAVQAAVFAQALRLIGAEAPAGAPLALFFLCACIGLFDALTAPPRRLHGALSNRVVRANGRTG